MTDTLLAVTDGTYADTYRLHFLDPLAPNFDWFIGVQDAMTAAVESSNAMALTEEGEFHTSTFKAGQRVDVCGPEGEILLRGTPVEVAFAEFMNAGEAPQVITVTAAD